MIKNLDRELKWGFPEFTKQGRKGFAENKELERLLKQILDLKGNERVLDVGCGIGTLCKLIAPLLSRGEIIGIDLDQDLIAYGKQHWAREFQFQLEVGDANHIAYPDQSFEIVVSMGLLENVSNPEVVLDEIERVVKKSGKLIFVHVDINNFVIRPIEEDMAKYYQDLRQGMRLAGVDLDMVHLLAYVQREHLPFKKFTLQQESRVKITDKYIQHVAENSQNSSLDEAFMEQACEFNYQYLRLMGWSREKVRNCVEREYLIANLLEFLKAHRGQVFYRKNPIDIYCVYF